MSDTISAEIIKILEHTVTFRMSNTAKYKLLLAIRKEEALYPDPDKIATKLVNGFTGIEDATSQEDIDKIAKLAVQAFTMIGEMLK
jgi:hypothetical protein